MRHEKHRRREGEEAHARSTTGERGGRLAARHTRRTHLLELGRRSSEPETTRPELEAGEPSGERHDACARAAASPLAGGNRAAATAARRDGHCAVGCRHRDSGRRQPRASLRARPGARLLRACLFVLCLETAALLRLQQEANWCGGGVATPSWLRRTLAF